MLFLLSVILTRKMSVKYLTVLFVSNLCILVCLVNTYVKIVLDLACYLSIALDDMPVCQIS